MKFSYPSGAKPLEGYTIKRGIGIGGFGEVYFALSDAGKEVALKKIQRNLDVELRGVRQCLNLKHVNLISLWDIRSNDMGESWVVMEYVPGPSLRDAVEANIDGMPEEQIKTWFTSTASGVAYLHEHGIVHRDLKPGNIFCDEDEQVIKIGDYGLSKFISCSRRSGQTESVGTFHYMAPEIGKGIYGKEIDIYALGIILYEMLTGDVPFEGESSQEIIMKHLTADPDVSILPDGFREVIAKALQKDPELRYRSVPEMVADMPWPEIAANSQKIISQHAIGPMIAGAASIQAKRPTGSHPGKANDSGKEQSANHAQAASSKLPPIIIGGDEVEAIPEIVFGPLTDNSNYQTETTTRPASETGRTNVTGLSPIRIDDDWTNEQTGKPNPISPVLLSQVSTGEEPIAMAVQSGFATTAHWWNHANFSTPVKMILLIIAGLVVVKNSQWLLPLVLGVGLIYILYSVGRLWISDSAEKNRSRSLREAQRKKIALVRCWLGSRPSSDRATELVGSLLVAAFACIVLNLLGFALVGGIMESSVESWANFTWLTLISIVGCWALIVCSKGWEHQHQDGGDWPRRLVLVGIGLAVGAIAFFSAGSFNLNLTQMAIEDFQARQTSQFVIRGVPLFPAYLIFFAGLFGILRWWRQTDPVRKTRLSILNVVVCLIWATLFSHLLNVPLTGNCILAAVMSIAVQLASPWLHPEDHDEICAELQSDSLVG